MGHTKLIFNKIVKDNIFVDDFKNFKESNVLDFYEDKDKNITILYGPNGTGKTSLAKVLDSKEQGEFEVEYLGKKYSNDSSSFFHVISDQNRRNIIAGNTSEFLLGDDIRKEYELKVKIEGGFDKLFKDIKSEFKSSFGIKKLNHPIVASSEEEIKDFSNFFANQKSKPEFLIKEDFYNFLLNLENIKIENYDDDKLKFLIDNHLGNDVISEIISLKNIDEKNSDIKKIEENDDAIKILEKYNQENCIVCDHEIDREELLHSKNESKKNIVNKLSENAKKILEKIINKIDTFDPFDIKSQVITAILNGDFTYIQNLQREINSYIDIYKKKLNNYYVEILINNKDLFDDLKLYEEMLEKKPEFTDVDLKLIEKIIAVNISKNIELQRSKDGNIELTLEGEQFIGIDREKLHLSNGEQNFISLAFEFLKAKNKTSEFIVLDDPISSFDSIYKNKIAFILLKILEGRKLIVLSHNVELIRLLQHQREKCFSLYLLNNKWGEQNGFIPVNDKEQDLLLYLDKLLRFFRSEVKNEIDESGKKNYLISMIPFLRGYANIIGNTDSYEKLSKLMHGYEKESINLVEVHNELFNYNLENSQKIDFSEIGEISVKDILEIPIDNLVIFKEYTNYPLLDRTLKHTFKYLYLRLKVEETLVRIKNLVIKDKKHPNLGNIIFNAVNDDDERKIFLYSRKTLLNEFNHFEGNMNIFQPAIDITDAALEDEVNSILEFLAEFEEV